MNALEKMISEGALENLVANIDKAAQEAASLAHELRGHAAVATDEFQMTAQGARGLMQSVENQVDPVAGEAIQTMEEIQKALARAEKALSEIEHLAADYSADSDFGFELSTALNEIAATARSVRALTDMLQQQPDALLRGKAASGGN
jgi:paraquat-inducible protein B